MHRHDSSGPPADLMLARSADNKLFGLELSLRNLQAPLPVSELKRVIEMLPLERSAVAVVAPCLATLEPADFAALLSELARDNHAFRYTFYNSLCFSQEEGPASGGSSINR